MSGYDTFLGPEEDLTPQSSSRPFDSDGYIGYDPRLPSQRFEPFETSEEQFREPKDDELNGMDSNGFTVNNNSEDYEGSAQPSEASSVMFGHGFENGHQSGFTSDFGVNGNENGVGNGLVDDEVNGIYRAMPEVASDGPILPDLHEMQPEEGFALREWRRENAIRLEEKERREKEELIRIIDEAESYREEFYTKRKKHCETNKNNNREKEKVYVANQEKFHANADKEYWKAIAELIPHELPTIETRKGGKDKDKSRNTIVVNHGPKPGNPTDLSWMRQILLKLKHNPPPHMKSALPTAAAADGSGPVLPTGTVVAVVQSTAPPQAVAVA